MRSGSPPSRHAGRVRERAPLVLGSVAGDPAGSPGAGRPVDGVDDRRVAVDVDGVEPDGQVARPGHVAQRGAAAELEADVVARRAVPEPPVDGVLGREERRHRFAPGQRPLEVGVDHRVQQPAAPLVGAGADPGEARARDGRTRHGELELERRVHRREGTVRRLDADGPVPGERDRYEGIRLRRGLEREREAVHLEELVLAGLGDVDDPVSGGQWAHAPIVHGSAGPWHVHIRLARPADTLMTCGFSRGRRRGVSSRAQPSSCGGSAAGRSSRLTTALLTCRGPRPRRCQALPDWVPPSTFLLLELVAVFLLLLRGLVILGAFVLAGALVALVDRYADDDPGDPPGDHRVRRGDDRVRAGAGAPRPAGCPRRPHARRPARPARGPRPGASAAGRVERRQRDPVRARRRLLGRLHGRGQP